LIAVATTISTQKEMETEEDLLSQKSQFTGSVMSGEMVVIQNEQGQEDSLEIEYPARPPRVPVPNITCTETWTQIKRVLAAPNKDDDTSVSSKENEVPTSRIAVAEPMKPPTKKPASTAKSTGDEDLSSKKRWPQYSNLIREYPALVVALLTSVDDCDAQNEQTAKNTENIKGNKWAHLQFVCFGGNRGALSGRLPPVEKATILKKKVMDIWKFIETNSADVTLSQELVSIALRQLEEYKKMDSELEASKDKLKKKQENLRASMVTYERKQGAIPPGAKESEPGRANHSTNCGLGQPAAFAYTHSMEQPNATPASSKAKKRGPSPAPSSSGRSSSINSAALEEVSGFNTAFQ
jgi:hypothetical protein